MELSQIVSVVTTSISIISIIIAILSFSFGRKDKSNADVKDESYKWGTIDTRLSNIEKCLEKIETKLDNYDTEIDDKIEKAIKNHINTYHK
jgi:hypothetical protein